MEESCDKIPKDEEFQFHRKFIEDSNNGLLFNNTYIPQEIVSIILSHIPPKEILTASLVCKKWCNIIKSNQFWARIYSREHKKKPKKLPWFVYYCFFTSEYFDTNLIQNGNGEENFKHWKIILNYGDEFKIEDPPAGSDPLPSGVLEFHGKTSCFATSFYECNKMQEISFEKNRLMQLILDKYRPHVYLSEWVAGRFDSGCIYTLWCGFYGSKNENKIVCFDDSSIEDDESDEALDDGHCCIFYDSWDEEREEPLFTKKTGCTIEQWAGSRWSKIELVVKDYPKGVKRIAFQHEGRDNQYWKGHYGSKMAGGVLKILFDSIEP